MCTWWYYKQYWGELLSQHNTIAHVLQCNRPHYTGDDKVCGYDEDQDGIPNEDLGCSDIIKCRKVMVVWFFISVHMILLKDICPYISNPGANESVCIPKSKFVL